MSSETTLVATQLRLRQWAEQIRDCNNRPEGMKVSEWCAQHDITTANYYYRMKRVRKACLDAMSPSAGAFIEVPVPAGQTSPVTCGDDGRTPSAVIKGRNTLSVEILEGISADLLQKILEAMAHAQ